MSGADGTLDVVIGCDCDPDRPQFGGARYDTRTPLIWHGAREGTPRAREIADGFVDDFGTPLRITWCVRSDRQMEEIYGDCGWPYAQFEDMWRELEASGDEIAWHPHLWRWSASEECWYQEIEDEGWIRGCLRDGYEALAGRMGHEPVTSRMGWEFHNDVTMRAIAELGIEVDFTAIPGRFTPGSGDRWGSRFNCHVDWRGTPREPYVPSPADYRRACDGGANGLVELPMSVARSPLLTAGCVARAALMGGANVRRRLARLRSAFGAQKVYVTAHPAAFGELVRSRVAAAARTGHATLVTAFHADEMLGDGNGAGALVSASNLDANLTYMVRRCRQSGVAVRHVTAAAAGRRERAGV